MKSLPTKIISVVMAVGLCMSVCGCASPTSELEDENCDNGHNLVQSSYTAPTCKTNGEEVYICSRCGFESKTTLLTIDHDYQVKSTTPSTCTVNGSQTLECSMCHETKTDTLPLKGHDYKLVNEIPSTCTVKGSHTYECQDCTDSYTNELDLLKHSFVEANTATCFVGGILKNICSECAYEEVIEETGLLAHSFGADGYCTKCGIYETFFDPDKIVQNFHGYEDEGIKITLIQGILSPKFKNAENAVPDSYLNSLKVKANLYIYTSDGLHDYQQTYYSYVNASGNLTLVWGPSNPFIINMSYCVWIGLYDAIEPFPTETLINATSFKIELSCEGYQPIEKTYNIT